MIYIISIILYTIFVFIRFLLILLSIFSELQEIAKGDVYPIFVNGDSSNEKIQPLNSDIAF